MDKSQGRRDELREFYERLSPEERRTRVILEPAFRDAYNEITQAHRQVPVPHYFWEKWVPVLGPIPSLLYMRLRQYCYYNPQTGEQRIECWPKQATLAKEIGVNQRQTVARALVTLEEYGFIKREPVYAKQARGDGAVKRTSDKYLIYFEIPLVAEDAAELLIRQSADRQADTRQEEYMFDKRTYTSIGGKGFMFAKRTHTPDPVDNQGFEFENRTYSAVRKTNSRSNTLTSTSNVSNVRENNSEEEERTPLRDHPTVAALSPDESLAREQLAFEIGEYLQTMSGDQRGGSHKSEGFHRRVAFLMPRHLVQEALTATRDAVEEQRAGRKSLSRGPSAYFAGIVQKIAEREGVDLGIKGW